MKTTVDLPDKLVKEIKLHAVHEGRKLKDAIADLLRKGLAAASPESGTDVKAEKAVLRRRRAVVRKFVSGEWGVELANHEAAAEADRRSASRRSKAWRK